MSAGHRCQQGESGQPSAGWMALVNQLMPQTVSSESGCTCPARSRTDGDCSMFRRFYVQKVLCSENIYSKGSMFRRFYIQKVLCSEGPIFRRSYIQKVLCSEGPMFRKTLFKRSYTQKVLCSEGPIFRYIQKVLYSENYLFYVGKNFQFQVNYNVR